MLILTRRREQDIVIGSGDDQVVVRVLEIRADDKVRLGIIARRDIPVHRREIAEQLAAEQRCFVTPSGRR